MSKNKRVHELCAQLCAQSVESEVSGVFRVFSIKVIEYKEPKPGVVAIGSLLPMAERWYSNSRGQSSGLRKSERRL